MSSTETKEQNVLLLKENVDFLQTIVLTLCQEFHLKPPRITATKNKCADWQLMTRTIRFPKYCEIMGALHEFAHMLADTRAGKRCKHGKPFYEALKETILAYGCKLEDYPWHHDYVCVRSRYEKELGE